MALVSLKPGDTPNVRPDGSDAKAARDYELAAKVGTKEAWDAFLAAHPTGFHAELARAQQAKSFPPKRKSTDAEAVVLKAIEAERGTPCWSKVAYLRRNARNWLLRCRRVQRRSRPATSVFCGTCSWSSWRR